MTAASVPRTNSSAKFLSEAKSDIKTTSLQSEYKSHPCNVIRVLKEQIRLPTPTLQQKEKKVKPETRLGLALGQIFQKAVQRPRPPMVRAMTALAVCRRFSASS